MGCQGRFSWATLLPHKFLGTLQPQAGSAGSQLSLAVVVNSSIIPANTALLGLAVPLSPGQLPCPCWVPPVPLLPCPLQPCCTYGEGMSPSLGAQAWGSPGSCTSMTPGCPSTPGGDTDTFACGHPPRHPGASIWRCVLGVPTLPAVNAMSQGLAQPPKWRRAESELLLSCSPAVPAPWGSGCMLSNPTGGRYPNACTSRI